MVKTAEQIDALLKTHFDGFEKNLESIEKVNFEISKKISEKDYLVDDATRELNNLYLEMTKNICSDPKHLLEKFKKSKFGSKLVKETVKNLRNLLFDDSDKRYQDFVCYDISTSQYDEIVFATFDFVREAEEDPLDNGSFSIEIPLVSEVKTVEYKNLWECDNTVHLTRNYGERRNIMSRESMVLRRTNKIYDSNGYRCSHDLKIINTNSLVDLKKSLHKFITEGIARFVENDKNVIRYKIFNEGCDGGMYRFLFNEEDYRGVYKEEMEHYNIFERFLKA